MVQKSCDRTTSRLELLLCFFPVFSWRVSYKNRWFAWLMNHQQYECHMQDFSIYQSEDSTIYPSGVIEHQYVPPRRSHPNLHKRSAGMPLALWPMNCFVGISFLPLMTGQGSWTPIGCSLHKDFMITTFVFEGWGRLTGHQLQGMYPKVFFW